MHTLFIWEYRINLIIKQIICRFEFGLTISIVHVQIPSGKIRYNFQERTEICFFIVSPNVRVTTATLFVLTLFQSYLHISGQLANDVNKSVLYLSCFLELPCRSSLGRWRQRFHDPNVRIPYFIFPSILPSKFSI